MKKNNLILKIKFQILLKKKRTIIKLIKIILEYSDKKIKANL